MATHVTHAAARRHHYSLAERAQLWIDAGGDPAFAPAMAVVSLAENTPGDPTIVNSIGAGGLWQVYPGGSTNPRTNARQAVAKFNTAKAAGGTGFEPWKSSEDTWGAAVYDKKTGKVDPSANIRGVHIGDALKGLKLPGSDRGGVSLGDVLLGGKSPAGIDIKNPLSGVLGPLGDIANFFVGLGELLLTPEGWRRILKLVIGGILLLWGVSQLSKALAGVDPTAPLKHAAGGFTKGLAGAKS